MYDSGDFVVYRERIDEIRKQKGISTRRWSEESGVSLDTIARVIHPEHHEKDSPRVSTLEELCKPLGIELWEIFYDGGNSVVSMQSEILELKAVRDALLAENASQKAQLESLKEKIDSLKDEIIEIHRHYIKSRKEA